MERGTIDRELGNLSGRLSAMYIRFVEIRLLATHTLEQISF